MWYVCRGWFRRKAGRRAGAALLAGGERPPVGRAGPPPRRRRLGGVPRHVFAVVRTSPRSRAPARPRPTIRPRTPARGTRPRDRRRLKRWATSVLSAVPTSACPREDQMTGLSSECWGTNRRPLPRAPGVSPRPRRCRCGRRRQFVLYPYPRPSRTGTAGDVPAGDGSPGTGVPNQGVKKARRLHRAGATRPRAGGASS